MKKEDFDYLYKQLEELEAEVERLKRENPDDDYQELDETVDKFRQMISDENIKQYKRNMIKRRLLSNFFNFLVNFFLSARYSSRNVWSVPTDSFAFGFTQICFLFSPK